MAQTHGPQRPRRTLTSVLGAVLAALTLAGCGGDPVPTSLATATPTPIAKLDTEAMDVVRVAFCDLVPRPAIRRALAGGAVSATSWNNGDPVPGAAADVGHEVGCAWKGKDGRNARAWVFARPVSDSFARSLVDEAAEQKNCRTVPGPSFGTPTLAQICSLKAPGIKNEVARVRYAGLFGDTWLTCEVTGPRTERDAVKARAGTWCASVATTLNVAG